MRSLELLAPARNLEIGIAAISCGADAVYIAGPRGGARKDAGNPISDIAALCSYAHRFGARIFVTFNILLRDEELPAIHSDMLECQKAGADAFIIRDPRLAQFPDIFVPFHASTQCSIRTPERAKLFEAVGCSRVTLERELSLSQIRAIASATSCEVECFVHGALCVSYSGQCRLSEYITSRLGGQIRSADRGECIQACRNLYDLEDENGRVLRRNMPLLSLKDLNLSGRLAQLASAGVSSFKIEGRLKSASYVRNCVRAYSLALDEVVRSSGSSYCRASFGTVEGGFRPDLRKSFNRGYTELYLDGKRSCVASLDSTKWAGEPVGSVTLVRPHPQGVQIAFKPSGLTLENGDGFAFVDKGELHGFRGDVCSPGQIITRSVRGLRPGMMLYRNVSASFEREMDAHQCRRFVSASVSLRCLMAGEQVRLEVSAVSEDGRKVSLPALLCQRANDAARAAEVLKSQIEKRSGDYSFSLKEIVSEGEMPFLRLSQVNELRRNLARELDSRPCGVRPLAGRSESSREVLSEALQTGVREGELMRMKYCIRYELGLCPRYGFAGGPVSEKVSLGSSASQRGSSALQRGNSAPQPGSSAPRLYLVNNGLRFPLLFDCSVCEMAVLESGR